MFEDSTFESAGSIHTRSRRWMMAAFALNGSIVLSMVLIPILHPEALPRQAIAFLMQVPPPPVTPPPAPRQQVLRTTTPAPELAQSSLIMPRQIPRSIATPTGPEPDGLTNVALLDSGSGQPIGLGESYLSQTPPRVVHPGAPAPVRISSGVAASIAIEKMLPVYPPIAKAAGIQGTVILAAIISRSGTVENLRVLSGPAMLRQASLDAVKTWRFRPYLLNGDPVEVETTVNVVFALQR